MLARGALCRLAVPKTSARDLPKLARFLGRALLSRSASTLPAVRALSRALTAAIDARRAYATTAAATRPTATVKKAVKAQAASKAPPLKKAAAKAPRKTATKPAAKKAKPRAKKTAKKPAKKPAAKKRTVRKALTPEEKEKAATKKQSAKLTALRKQALKEPSPRGSLSAYTAYIMEQVAGKGQPGSATEKLVEKSRTFKNLTPAELEHYNHVAHEKNVARQAEFRAWIQSYTPEQIEDANRARAQLRRLLKNTLKRRYPSHTAKLIDDRHVKKGKTSYNFFFNERWASGDMKGIKAADAAKLIGTEWKALNAGEKKKYEDEAAADAARVQREKKATAA